jgi:uncharacterized protein
MPMPQPPTDAAMQAANALSAEDFDALEAILDDLRSRSDETPQWEFCEGFMAALIVCRRPIAPSEYLPVLLDTMDGGEGGGGGGGGGGEQGAGGTDGASQSRAAFSDTAQAAQFMTLWMRRWNAIAHSLDADIESLDDPRAFHPEVLDLRGAVAALPETEREAMASQKLPSFAQVWAVGFMYAVESWPQEWVAPRGDKEAHQWLDQALDAIVALTEDDTDPPTIAVFEEDGPPGVSEPRLQAFATAVWAVYDLHELWRNIGPRVEQLRTESPLGRNDTCFCGSGKKFKKCHGA